MGRLVSVQRAGASKRSGSFPFRKEGIPRSPLHQLRRGSRDQGTGRSDAGEGGTKSQNLSNSRRRETSIVSPNPELPEHEEHEFLFIAVTIT